jgi:hypothetical protein
MHERHNYNIPKEKDRLLQETFPDCKGDTFNKIPIVLESWRVHDRAQIETEVREYEQKDDDENDCLHQSALFIFPSKHNKYCTIKMRDFYPFITHHFGRDMKADSNRPYSQQAE